MPESLGFDWDERNTEHIKSHRVSPAEFEQVIANEPFDLEYQVESGEERYKSLGITDNRRVLIVIWTLRGEKIRAVTAYPAGKTYERLYQKIRG